jgi:hypothetical protein
MSAAVNRTVKDTVSVAKIGSDGTLGPGQPAKLAGNKNYKGFVAGVFSGIAKLTGRQKYPSMP